MNKPERFGAIDFLRGVAIFVMIALHTLAYFLSNKLLYDLWNYGNFVVPIFIFVSAFLFFRKEIATRTELSFSYIKKRLSRLIIPYYIFLVVYFFLMFMFERHKLTGTFILKNITFLGGVDINWLVILFLYMSVLLPVLSFAQSKSRWTMSVVTVVSLLTSIFLLFFKLPLSYKLTMWVPWLLVVAVAYYHAEYEENKNTLPIFFLLSTVVFLASWLILDSIPKNTGFFQNKYPPNLYLLSYGTMWIGALFLFYPLISAQKQVMYFFNYFGKYSYTLFFIHYIVIYILAKGTPYKTFGWLPFFIFVTLLSVLGQVGLNRLSLRSKKSH